MGSLTRASSLSAESMVEKQAKLDSFTDRPALDTLPLHVFNKYILPSLSSADLARLSIVSRRLDSLVFHSGIPNSFDLTKYGESMKNGKVVWERVDVEMVLRPWTDRLRSFAFGKDFYNHKPSDHKVGHHFIQTLHEATPQLEKLSVPTRLTHLPQIALFTNLRSLNIREGYVNLFGHLSRCAMPFLEELTLGDMSPEIWDRLPDTLVFLRVEGYPIVDYFNAGTAVKANLRRLEIQPCKASGMEDLSLKDITPNLESLTFIGLQFCFCRR